MRSSASRTAETDATTRAVAVRLASIVEATSSSTVISPAGKEAGTVRLTKTVPSVSGKRDSSCGSAVAVPLTPSAPKPCAWTRYPSMMSLSLKTSTWTRPGMPGARSRRSGETWIRIGPPP
jgi:hypothetical protein